MSEIIKKQVTCPKCAQSSEASLLCSANTESDKTVRTAIFDGSLFEWKCPHCGCNTALLHPLLYNDIRNKFMIYYIPRMERARVADEALDKQYTDIGFIRKRIVSNVNSLKEKIALFENGTNDMAVELAKYAVAEVVSKSTGKGVSEGYFTDMSEAENTISFQFFIGEDQRPYFQTTKYEVYARSLAIVKKCFPREERQGGFLNINRAWARAALKKYKSS